MFKAKDGSKHTNHSSMKSADARFSAKPPQKIGGGAPATQGDGGMMDDGDGQDQDQAQDGAALAQEHGPAVALDIQHDNEGGRHTVHAEHPDGHAHESEHPTADEAHKFAADCAGVGSGMQ